MIPFSSIAIIGYGDFGKLLVDIISDSSQDVRIGVISRKENIYAIARDELIQFDVIVSCVPISFCSDTYHNIKKFAHTNVLIRDVCSIKEQPIERLHQSGLENYIATHPMFGPYSYEKKGYSLDGLRLVITGYTCDDSMFLARKTRFESLGLLLLIMSPKQHDEYLAKTLFLTHYISQIIHHAGFDRTKIDTASFGFLMDAVESVKNDKNLFLDVWKFNPYCKKIIDKFLKSQKKIHQLLGL